MKIFIVLAFVGIVSSLAAAGFFMLRGEQEKKTSDMAKALTLRIGISVTLFAMLLIFWSLGWIEPTGVIPGQS